MHIGYVCKPGRGATDLLIAEVVALLAGQGMRLAGTVQTNLERPDRDHCDMDVQVLPDGPVFRISQDLGAAASGCRLNPSALEQAVAEVAQRLDGASALIVNKFGKHEAEGRGFRDLIAEALSRGLPVVLGVNKLNLPAFHSFTGDTATALPADATQIAAWVASLCQTAD